MIPYDDLVAALTSWRARQGLPTTQLPGAAASAPKAAVPAVAPAAKSGPAKAAGGGAKHARAQSPAVGHDEFDVDSELIEEGSYEGDYAAFGGDESAEATAIGTTPAPPRRGGR
jgi:hypothetical protein